MLNISGIISKFIKNSSQREIDRLKLIVDEIEAQLTRLDENVLCLNNVKKRLELYRKAVLKKAFEKKEGWEEGFLETFCEKITDGSHYTPKYFQKGYPFLSIKDRKNGKLNFKEGNLISLNDFFSIRQISICRD